NIIIIFLALMEISFLNAQDEVYPAAPHKGLLFIKNATIHVVNGQVIVNGTIKVNNGKIEQVGTNIAIPAGDVKVLDLSG
ncbi:hypothetical protein NK983_34510, partial [Salmonella enterica subsp. enterica serovar Typhimurium]|nr:hypothetical protein [Salmonella enterica subsp. enterica serovar Typhimurium]